MRAVSAAMGLLSAAEVALGASNASDDCITACCDAIQAAAINSHQVQYPGGEYYSAFNRRWSENAVLKPSCIFLAASADDVSMAVRILTSGAGNPNASCPFAIASGGTSTSPGANDIDGGATIDLTLIDQVQLLYNNTVASIGAGTSWPKVYEAMSGTRRAVAGGDDTGVGGMILAGGISPFSSRVGLTVDTVLNFEVVLASGEIVNANQTSHSDLFSALKGGGNNFGIVTRIDLVAFRNSALWGGEISVPINETSAVLSSLNYFIENNAQDPDSGARVTFSWNGTSQDGEISNYLWNSHNSQQQPSLAPFFNLSPQAAQLQNNVSLSQLFPSYSTRNYPGVHRSLFATVTIVNDNSTLFEVNKWTNAAIHSFQFVPDVEWRWSFDPLPRFYRNHGINPLGLNYTTADLIVVTLNPHWLDAAYDEDISQAAYAWVNAIQTETNVRNTSFPFVYAGFAASFQDPFTSYGASNLRFLQDTAEEYDPTGVFQTLVPGGFKLSKAGKSMPPRPTTLHA